MVDRNDIRCSYCLNRIAFVPCRHFIPSDYAKLVAIKDSRARERRFNLQSVLATKITRGGWNCRSWDCVLGDWRMNVDISNMRLEERSISENANVHTVADVWREELEMGQVGENPVAHTGLECRGSE